MPPTGTAVSRGTRVRVEDDRVGTAIEPTVTDGYATAAHARSGDDSPWGEQWASGGRRTVTIRGRGAERYVAPRPSAERRRNERRYERAGFKADRAAMWAVLLGVMLMLAAVTSAHAATLHALVH